MVLPADPLSGLSLWEATALVLGLSVVAAVGIELVSVRLIRRVVRHTESRFDDILFEELRLPIVVTVFLAGVYAVTQTPAAAATVLGEAGVEQFFGRPSLSIVVVVWAWALNQIVNRSVGELSQSGRQYEFAPVFSNVWTLAVLVTAGFLLLYVWDIEVTPLLGAAGIAGIAVGFAAKDTVANFFGGLALYFDDAYILRQIGVM